MPLFNFQTFRRFSGVSATPSPGISWKGRKKFYKLAEVKTLKNNESKYGLFLDNKQLFSPSRSPLIFSKDFKPLLHCVAHEWNAQIDVIQPSTMPLMTLTCSAIDVTGDLMPENEVSIEDQKQMKANREAIVEELLRFFTTDTLLYFQPDQPKLLERQKKAWSPILDAIVANFGLLDVATDTSAPKHPAKTIQNVKEELFYLDKYKLTAVESLAAGLKSLILPLVLLKCNTEKNDKMIKLNVEQAISAARLEEEHQIDEWGLVEGGHDVDRANLMVQVASAVTFLQLTNNASKK